MKTIAAPIHLDALILKHHTVVKDALADYSLLPYTDKSQDHNPDTPYVGEAILNQPFQDKNLLLSAGVHLHWSLPKGLSKTIGIRLIKKSDLDDLKPYIPKKFVDTADTWKETNNYIWNSILIASEWIKPVGKERAGVLAMDSVDKNGFDTGVNSLARKVGWSAGGAEVFIDELMKFMNKPLGSDYPCVPDIWLINRKKNGRVNKTWIVESHYIAKAQTAKEGNLSAVNVPFHDDRHDNKTQPFRFMGRQVEDKTSWTSDKLRGRYYLQEITAVGYNPQPGTKGFAEPTFAAFYPNCMSVFGFYDPGIVAPQAGLVYEVLGLYANPENDYLPPLPKEWQLFQIPERGTRKRVSVESSARFSN